MRARTLPPTSFSTSFRSAADELLALRRSVAASVRSIDPDDPDKASPMSLAEVIDLQANISRLSGISYERQFFGRPLPEAVSLGLRITHRGFFEATESSAADHTAQVALQTLKSIELPQPWRALDCFAGTGQVAWSLAQCGLSVTAIEKDASMVAALRHNFNTSAPRDRVTLVHGDALTLLSNGCCNTTPYSLVYLDPSWNGSWTYHNDRLFPLDNGSPKISDLIALALSVAPVVAVKLPQSLDPSDIYRIARIAGVKAQIFDQDVFPKVSYLNQSTVIFSRNNHGERMTRMRVKLFR